MKPTSTALPLRTKLLFSAGDLPVQPQSALNAIRFFVGPLPTVLLALAVVFALKYSITRASHENTLRQLGEIESGAQSTVSN